MKRSVAAALGAMGLAGTGLAGTAHADVELGGIAGLRLFSERNGIGVVDGDAPDSQKNSALFGVRLGVYFGPMFGVEVEGSVIPSEGRGRLYDVWNLTYRASVVAQLRGEAQHQLVPFALIGGGAHTILSSTNDDFITEDTAPVPHAGAGFKYRTGNGFGVRFDARALLPPSSAGDGVTVDFELLATIYRDFGWRKPAPAKPLPPPPPPVDEDPDKDGLLGAADKCPSDAEDKDGFQDDDGCPDPDNDGDGVADAADRCPLEPEDKDGFTDEDGCRELDNDEDGVLDANDKCGTEPETRNGYLDDDGCADEVPEKLRALLAAPQPVAFRPNAAELAAGAPGTKALDALVAVLLEVKDVTIEIGVHTDDQPPPQGSKLADNQALSQARADAVKAYLVSKGVEEGRLAPRGYADTAPLESPTGLTGPKLTAARAKNRRVELKLVIPQTMVVPAPEAAPPAPAPGS